MLRGQALVDTAKEIMHDWHAGQRYGELPYEVHPISVANLARAYGYNEETRAASLLHDTVEDTEITPEYLLERGIPGIVVDAVTAVTFVRDKTVPRSVSDIAKIDQARSHPIGHVVKFLDSSCNLSMTTRPEEVMSPGRRLRLTTRYIGYTSRLLPGLPKPEDIRNITHNYYESLREAS